MGKDLKVGRDSPGYLLRLPSELREEIKREADISSRSMNSVILSRLLGSYGKEKKAHKVEEPARSMYYALSETEQTLFALLKKLPIERQLALITLLK